MATLSPKRPKLARTSAPPRSARCGHLREENVNAFAWTSSAPVDTRTPEFCGRPSSVAKRMPTTAELASFTVFSTSEASGAMSLSSSAAVGAGTARMTWS